ncbi:hypothetical protein GCM10010247_37490 [Streptomyces calvus]|nr:hypothetical protein GCM10010247_37490 [Streptomyces calvus]
MSSSPPQAASADASRVSATSARVRRTTRSTPRFRVAARVLPARGIAYPANVKHDKL